MDHTHADYSDNAKHRVYLTMQRSCGNTLKNDSKKAITFAPLISYKKSIMSNKERGTSQITSQTQRFCGRNWIICNHYLLVIAK